MEKVGSVFALGTVAFLIAYNGAVKFDIGILKLVLVAPKVKINWPFLGSVPPFTRWSTILIGPSDGWVTSFGHNGLAYLNIL